MKIYFFLIFFLSLSGFAQDEELSNLNTKKDSTNKSLRIDHSKDNPKAKFEQYRIVSLERDTLYIDTSLTIKSMYRHNYLRKDIFGLMPFANEGQTYNTLNFGLKKITSALPEMGFKAKHFNFYEADKIKYYSVATPFTELYFKTVMEQGQTLSTTIAINTSERLNFSVGFKGLRSLGKYLNTLSSSGNVVFTGSYSTKKQQYLSYLHFTGQDILNGENGGLTNKPEFELNDPSFLDRARISINLKDATSFLKGRRFFLDHRFRLNADTKKNNVFFRHQINYENKFFEYNQLTVNQSLNIKLIPYYSIFGPSFVSSGLVDQTQYNKLYNKVGFSLENDKLGKINLFVDDFRSNSYYNKVLFLSGKTIPSSLTHKVQSLGGKYENNYKKWSGCLEFSKALTIQNTSNFVAKTTYNLNEENQFSIEVQNLNKLPNDNFLLYQSNFSNYNWSNDFKNQNETYIKIDASTKWGEASIQLTNSQNHLYFKNIDLNGLQLVKPFQYDKSINYASLKISKELSFWKLSLDNTLLLQEVSQSEKIINVPAIITRNSLYFTDYFYGKALYLQTGATLNYHSKYYGDTYNPVIGEFFIQKNKKIGGFATIDFFINARIRQTRIFLVAEHLNSSFSGRNYLSDLNNPYHDFLIRFGIAWNFFQ